MFVANAAMAGICLGETTKGELLLLPWGEPFLSLDSVAQAACTAFHENNSLAWLKTPFKGVQELKKSLALQIY